MSPGVRRGFLSYYPVSGMSLGSPGSDAGSSHIAGCPTRVLIAGRPARVAGPRISDTNSNRRASGAIQRSSGFRCGF